MTHDRSRRVAGVGRASGAQQQQQQHDPQHGGVPGKRTLTEMAFPHAPAIAAATGAAVPGTAVLDPRACDRRGVPAFTDGLVTHFATDAPELHVAAHEAAHQLQHAGVTGDAGLGPEQHAHEVADAVASGKGAHELLASGGAAVPSAVRNYTEMTAAEQTAKNEWKVGGKARVGDAGRTLTTENMHECFADAALIAAANDILKAKRSGVELAAGAAGPSGNAPDGSGWKSLVEVKPTIKSSTGGDDYWTDCGRASREVQGPTGQDSQTHGVYNDPAGSGKRLETTATAPKDPLPFRDEIYQKGGLGSDAASARAAYLALDPAAKDAFDKKMGINRYAAPGVGESFTSRRDDALAPGEGFNYHWGGVIMVADPDRVTFENYARPGTTYDSKNQKWFFETYGPPAKAGQTFHDQYAETGSVGGPGKNSTTMVARTSPDPKEISSLSTAELVKRYAAAATTGEKTMLETELGKREILVTVKVVGAQEGEDQVYIVVSGGGRRHESGWSKLKSGQSFTFHVPISRLFPIQGHLSLKVYEYDTLSDDLISNQGWDPPYAPTTDSRPWDGAEYHSTIAFDSY